MAIKTVSYNYIDIFFYMSRKRNGAAMQKKARETRKRKMEHFL